MTKKVIGFDENGRKIWERDARLYDHSLGKTVLGVSVGDIVKAVPVVFLCGIVYANQQTTNKTLFEGLNSTNAGMKVLADQNNKTINLLSDYISTIDTYLSATTGKQFRNGQPREGSSYDRGNTK